MLIQMWTSTRHGVSRLWSLNRAAPLGRLSRTRGASRTRRISRPRGVSRPCLLTARRLSTARRLDRAASLDLAASLDRAASLGRVSRPRDGDRRDSSLDCAAGSPSARRRPASPREGAHPATLRGRCRRTARFARARVGARAARFRPRGPWPTRGSSASRPGTRGHHRHAWRRPRRPPARRAPAWPRLCRSATTFPRCWPVTTAKTVRLHRAVKRADPSDCVLRG